MSNDDANSAPTIATTAAPAEGLTITCRFDRPQRGGRVQIIEPGSEAAEAPHAPKPLPFPTIVRSLVRAHAYERMIRSGAATSYADVAAQVKLTTARLAQMAALLNLAPDLQAEILSLAAPENRNTTVDEREVRGIAGEPDWAVQRVAWSDLLARAQVAGSTVT